MLQLSYNSLLLILPFNLILIIFFLIIVFNYNIRYKIYTNSIFILVNVTIFALVLFVSSVPNYNTFFFSFKNFEVILVILIYLSVCFTFFVIFNMVFIFEEIVILLTLLVISIFAISANNFISLFVCFESINICFFILMLSSTDETRVLEAALQYIFVSIVASLLFLLGIIFVYLSWGSFFYNDILLYFLYTDSTNWDIEMLLGFFLIICGFFIKLGIFPFYNWMVVVYSNLTTKPLILVICFIKFIFSLMFLKLIFTFWNVFYFSFSFIFFFGGLGSLIVSSFNLLIEQKTKRYIAFLSPNSTGFLVLFWCSLCNEWVYLFSISYISIQSFSFAFLFGFLSFFKTKNEIPVSILYLRNYAEINFTFLIFFILVLFSLIGIPPFPGFFPKLGMLFYFFQNKSFFLLTLFLFFTLMLCFILVRIIFLISRNVYFVGLLLVINSFKGYLCVFCYILFIAVSIVVHFQIYKFFFY